MGVKGSALATVIGSSVSATWVLLHFTVGKSAIRLKARHFGFHWDVMAPALFIGLAPCLMQVSASLVAATANHQLARYGGDMAVGAIAIINSIAMLFLMPVIGINQGAQPIIGFNYGARQFNRVRAAWRQAALAATAIAASGCLLVHLFPEGLIGLFSREDPALHDIAVPGLKIFLSLFFLVGFQTVSANYFQAAGKPRTAIVLNLLRQVILFIPALFVLPRFFGLTGIWLSAPVSDLTAASITFAVMLREYRFLKTVTPGEASTARPGHP
jgi:Na+-driven multidrug efflux pump